MNTTCRRSGYLQCITCRDSEIRVYKSVDITSNVIYDRGITIEKVMNNLTITPQGDNLYTVVIGGMSKGKIQDWAQLLVGDVALVTEPEDGNWEYVFTIENVTQVGLERIRGYDYTLHPSSHTPKLLERVDVIPNDVPELKSGFRFKRRNGYTATCLFKGQGGYYFITETEARPLLVAVKEDDLVEFLCAS